MHRDADGAGLVRDGAGDGLADPPGGVGGELVAAAVLELLDGLHQAHVALLDQVEEGEAAVGVLLRDGDDEAEVGLDHLGLGLVRLADMDAGLGDDGEERAGGDALGGLDLLEAVVDGAAVEGGVLLGLRVLRALELGVEGLDLLEGGAELLEVLLVDLQLEEELAEIRAEHVLALPVLRHDLLPVVVGLGLEVFLPRLGDGLLGLLGVLDELGQALEVGLAAVDLLVDDDAVEALLAVEELGAERADVGADGGGLEEGGLGLELGILDALGNLDLLLAGQQRDLAHLLEVHADRVVEDVVLRGAALLLLGLLHALLVIVDLVGLEDLDLEVLQDGKDVVDLLLVLDGLGQRLVDVVEREIALLLGEADQVADLVVDPARGNVTGGAFGGGGLRVLGDDGLDGFGVGIGGGGLGFARHRKGRVSTNRARPPRATGVAGGAGVGFRSVLLRVKLGQNYCPHRDWLKQVLFGAAAARGRGPAAGGGLRWPP